MIDQFSRTRTMLGEAGMQRLQNARVAVFGVGGVGGYAVEALARSGVGTLDLIDDDEVCLTNLNRQIIATHETLGRPKVEVFAQRIRSINPDAVVNIHLVFFGPDTAGQFDFSAFDYVVDAIDTVSAKVELAFLAQQAGVPVISSMGAAGKMDPTAFEVADLYATSVCPLARAMRTQCRKRGIRHLKVVYSRETPHAVPSQSGGSLDTARTGPARRPVPGSNAFVPPVAGLILAGEVIKDLAGWPELADKEVAKDAP